MKPLALTAISEAEPIGLMAAILPWLRGGPGNVGGKNTALCSLQETKPMIFSATFNYNSLDE